jgi:hypothetical protein
MTNLFKENGEPEKVQTRREVKNCCVMIFGGLAIIVTGVTVDPLALRPRLSPGLPFQMFLLITF